MAWMNFSNGTFAEALVWTILHSFWQFFVIALVMSILLKMYQDHKSLVRYYISLGSMVAALLIFVFTFTYYYQEDSTEVILFSEKMITEVNAIIIQNSLWDRLNVWITIYQKPIFLTWILGVILFGVRLVASLVYVEFLVKTMSPIYHQNVYKTFMQMTRHFGIKENIRIGESKHIKSPMILGLIKPVILFPIGMINQLDTAEVDAILAHELAHFVRKDIYINVIQTMIEAVLYYHPAIWWISANIRVERENCCDEMAVGYLGDNIQYAKTLVKMQEIQVNGPALALNFNHQNSFFSNRIKRILNMSQTRNFLKEKIITTLVLAILVVFTTKELSGSQASPEKSITQQTINKQITMQVLMDSLPKSRESIRIQKRTHDQDIKISMEDGKVTELEVDGKKIDEADYDKYEDIISEATPKSSTKGNARMFFFGDEEPQKFEFNFGEDGKLFADSLFGKFEGFKNFEGFQHFDGFGEIDMGKLTEQMKKLQEQMGGMKFDFRHLDSMDLNGMDGFKFDFAFPDKGGFGFGNEDTFIAPFGDYPESMPDFAFPNGKTNFSEVLGNALNRDGLLIPNQNNKVELTGKHLKINGEKQPNNIYQKYRRIFEEQSGTSLEKNSKLQFSFEGKESKRKFKVY